MLPGNDALRQQLVALKVATLHAQATRMGLKAMGEEISAAALAKIQADVAALPEAELLNQVEHWTVLNRRAVNALATRPMPPASGSST